MEQRIREVHPLRECPVRKVHKTLWGVWSPGFKCVGRCSAGVGPLNRS